ncbi:rhomboid family intramembrane serine protease [Metabacillus herbersteinensis]|uniref:Rhomboid family intramembrane serine protease n=1 Tax=Metabacillus herbersteinensis TaxID=283816 RepID=A0ABV6GAQ1_9BACI
MVMEQDYLFWQMVDELVIKQQFNIIRLSEDQREVWLEPRKNKQYGILRLKRYDVDWGNWLANDLEEAATIFESLRKQSQKRSFHVLNVYISTYPPVDDFPLGLSEPFKDQQTGKTTVTSVFMDKENKFQEPFPELENFLQKKVRDLVPTKEVGFDEVQKLKFKVLSYSNQRVKEERKVFEYGKPLFTYFFIGLQVFMFLLLEFYGGSTNTETLVQFGAKFNPLIAEGEWWRFFTPIVLHIGMLHLFMNSLALLYVGSAVEKIYGSTRFLVIYLLAGVAGTIASFAFSPSVSAGASGAIFGCFGALLYLGIVLPKLFFRTLGSNILVVVGINLALGFVIPGIDNAGHLGGLIGGFLAAVVVQLPKQNKFILRAIAIALTIFLLTSMYGYGKSQTETQLQQYRSMTNSL